MISRLDLEAEARKPRVFGVDGGIKVGGGPQMLPPALSFTHFSLSVNQFDNGQFRPPRMSFMSPNLRSQPTSNLFHSFDFTQSPRRQ